MTKLLFIPNYKFATVKFKTPSSWPYLQTKSHDPYGYASSGQGIKKSKFQSINLSNS